MTDNLLQQLQVWGFEKDLIVFSDFSVGFGLRAKPLSIDCWDDEEVNPLNGRLVKLLNSLPTGIEIQFIQDITKGNETAIAQHQALSEKENPKLVTEITNLRCMKLREDDQKGELPLHQNYVFVRVSDFAKRKCWLLKDTATNNGQERLQKSIKKAEDLKEDLHNIFRSSGLLVEPLTSDEIFKFIYKQWNPGSTIPVPSYDSNDIRESLLFTDLVLYENGFSLGKIHHRLISLKLLPEVTFISMAKVLNRLPIGSRTFFTIQTEEQQKEISELQMERRLSFSMVQGAKSGMPDIESEAKYDDLENLLVDVLNGTEKIFRFSLNILLTHQDNEVLDREVNEALLLLRELSGAEGMLETVAAFDIFSEIALPNARAKERLHRMKSSNLADLLPLYGPWGGHVKPSLILKNQSDNLLKFDPFSPTHTNFNQLVSGGSGSGKSFFTNLLLLQMLKERPKVFIVDIGASYKKITETLSGQYIPLILNSKLSINPFDTSGEVSLEQKSKLITTLVEIMTKEENESSLKKLEKSEIEKAVLELYNKHESPRLSHLQEALSLSTLPEIKRLATILKSWVGETLYGKFLDRPTSIDLSCDFICFDLKGLEFYPDLQKVVFLIITDLVWREVQKNRGQKKFLVFDESWKLLEDQSSAQFIAEVFRTFRKYNASAIAISQNLDDFAKSQAAQGILSNSSIRWILKQRGADQKRIQEILHLNDNELSLIGSLSQSKGFYSEAFLMAEEEKTVVRVESTPLEYWLATTDAMDLVELEKVKEKHPDRTEYERLKVVAQKFPHGVAHAQTQGGPDEND